MSPSTHGGARPGARRKPKTQPASTTAPVDPAHLAQVHQRLGESLPQLLDALLSLAQGTTTTHERWVAAGTLRTQEHTHRGDCYERALFPWREEEELVLVARDTYTHKPDSRALLFVLQYLLPQNLDSQLPTNPNPTPESLAPLSTPQPTPDTTTPPHPVSPCPPFSCSSTIELSAPPRLCGFIPHSSPPIQHSNTPPQNIQDFKFFKTQHVPPTSPPLR